MKIERRKAKYIDISHPGHLLVIFENYADYKKIVDTDIDIGTSRLRVVVDEANKELSILKLG